MIDPQRGPLWLSIVMETPEGGVVGVRADTSGIPAVIVVRERRAMEKVRNENIVNELVVRSDCTFSIDENENLYAFRVSVPREKSMLRIID